MTSKKPILVLLAAGMGSRYGGLKQIDPLGPNGEILMDYSLFDAKKAGFERIVFIIKKEVEEAFDEVIGSRIKKEFEVRYAFQDLNDIPAGFSIPEGRVKPWGTAHAVLAARELIDAPFAVINADDYYGPHAFKLVYDALTAPQAENEQFIVPYILGNTLSKNGHVARGICEISEDGYLQSIVERKMIRDAGDKAQFSVDGGETWQDLDKSSPVSMNFWGLTADFVKEIQNNFEDFLRREVPADPLKAEYLLPSLVGDLIKREALRVRCRSSQDSWFGVTYKEDKPAVMESIRKMIAEGRYPEKLWR